MHAGERERTLDAIAECLRSFPVAESLPVDWEQKLLGEHRRFLDRDRAVDTTVCWEFGHKPGWVTIDQRGGSMSADLWSLEARDCVEAREEMETLAHRLRAEAIHLSNVRTRFTTPAESNKHRGWPHI